MTRDFVKEIVLPRSDSRKGENGRVLVIGGSKLFHAASFWSASMAAKIVDMVHFSSPVLENNELMRGRAKDKFWDGIVVPWEEVEHYIKEDDVILIGPGMVRSTINSNDQAPNYKQIQNINIKNQNNENTREIVNYFLAKYPDKKWVVDGGALQEVDPKLLNKNMIVTPNFREINILLGKITNNQNPNLKLGQLGITVLEKGVIDKISDGTESVEVAGGSAGMTKGGSGDVLAGLVAGLYAKSSAMAACVVASMVNKKAGEELEQKVGTFFSAYDLIGEAQKQLGIILPGDSRKVL
ncbi:MAG: ADP/ATP-dependent (S)-NAD(P)H-hydrate dehydratase [Microgenomates group bacterium]